MGFRPTCPPGGIPKAAESSKVRFQLQRRHLRSDCSGPAAPSVKKSNAERALRRRQILATLINCPVRDFEMFGGVPQEVFFDYVPRHIIRDDKFRDTSETLEGVAVGSEPVRQVLTESGFGIGVAVGAQHRHENLDLGDFLRCADRRSAGCDRRNRQTVSCRPDQRQLFNPGGNYSCCWSCPYLPSSSIKPTRDWGTISPAVVTPEYNRGVSGDDGVLYSRSY